jgi:hypothetical protein
MNMKTKFRVASAMTLVAPSSLMAAGIALAEKMTEVAVDVPRVVKQDASHPGAPYDAILRGHVSYSDLNLPKKTDAATLEQRINDKARDLRPAREGLPGHDAESRRVRKDRRGAGDGAGERGNRGRGD